MVSIFRRSTSRFFACTLLQMGSCSPRAPREQGLPWPRAFRGRVCCPAAPGRQGWEAGRVWLVHCQTEGFQELCSRPTLCGCVCPLLQSRAGCCGAVAAAGWGRLLSHSGLGLRAAGAEGYGGTLQMPWILHPILPCPALHLLP